ncbi:Predicted signal transduction protein containing Nacht domain [Trichormus variabilis ATCC 29413]|uniref:Predicted signal transduction protein containing Nacht domain n=2 Tax=Anabaena variabilis TaxID=264691 RepID=Q3MBU8_TRIV2|nr:MULTISPECIES: NACHT domain-containing NTPase [Nostocaceae]ABA21538.1 Predicted signal transduction protein containing Nacht domain [Trichormus variabilis ATCC 29413]MBC1213898.1 NACHT domain-containing NTPase [Trichormus variabilis ARAD]MBC1256762.1 NACHT domain-containing NTPase [Trichormus variabilis V5]MBC1266003.1 NACHT domain-containing NTPase [Trichormus variabilis FSR]MBC1302048.1 NACHT domain-containing NTPase [Trichormus variabilis N2B]
MTSQGLRASPEGIRAAKTALTDKTLTQQKLAAALGITRQPVSKFFAGEPVSRSCFVQICQQLGLSWQKVVGLAEEAISETTLQPKGIDLDVLVREVRQKRQEKIQDQCCTLQMLDIAQAIPLSEIYTPVSILEEITSQQWREISDLMNDWCLESNFQGFGQGNHQRALAGLDAISRYSKLMLLGKPGSGKTTFLQYLAMECNHGKLRPNQVPIFIRLKEFAEDTQRESELNLLQYLLQEFSCNGVEEESTLAVLAGGKALILLDALDEVPLSHVDKVIREIRKFIQTFYKNQFVITCRVSAQKYRFQGFTEVEIADFQEQQRDVFVRQWFMAVAHLSSKEGESTCNIFTQQLNLPENQRIRELANTPILLHLLCLVFRVKMQFPYKPANLYEQALNILLARWDETRGIKRDDFYAHLNLANKKKLLCYLAVHTFVKGDYFFTSDKIQNLICDYLSNQSNTIDLQQHSIAVLQGIEAQDGLLVERARGIDSFSHLAFQEYLTAKYIVDDAQNYNWQLLINHIGEERWHNLLFLIVSMLDNPDEILQLMKDKIDELVAADEKIQSYLVWLHQKTSEVVNSQQVFAARAFYIICSCTFTHSANDVLAGDLFNNLSFNSELALDQLLFSTLNCVSELELGFEQNLHHAHAFNYIYALNINFDEAINVVNDAEFREELQKLKRGLPSAEGNLEKVVYWWYENGKLWNQQLRSKIIKYRNIGYDWQFNQQQVRLLQQYFEANKLLRDCLRYALDSRLKRKIEDELFLVYQKR